MGESSCGLSRCGICGCCSAHCANRCASRELRSPWIRSIGVGVSLILSLIDPTGWGLTQVTNG